MTLGRFRAEQPPVPEQRVNGPPLDPKIEEEEGDDWHEDYDDPEGSTADY